MELGNSLVALFVRSTQAEPSRSLLYYLIVYAVLTDSMRALIRALKPTFTNVRG